jgi:hypothetical protein
LILLSDIKPERFLPEFLMHEVNRKVTMENKKNDFMVILNQPKIKQNQTEK